MPYSHCQELQPYQITYDYNTALRQAHPTDHSGNPYHGANWQVALQRPPQEDPMCDLFGSAQISGSAAHAPQWPFSDVRLYYHWNPVW